MAKKGAKASQAALHVEAISAAFDSLTVRSAVDLDEEGEVRLLVDNVMRAQFERYDVHETLWTPNGPDVDVELVHAPLSCFANNSGAMMYCGPMGGSGIFDLDRENWLVAKGRSLGVGLALAWMFGSITTRDWIEYNEGFGLPGVHGKTRAKINDPEWNAFADAIDSMVARFKLVTGMDNEIVFSEASSQGGAAFEPMQKLMQRYKIVMCMDSDLSTLSNHDSQGASVQGDSDDQRIAGDARFVEDTLNRRLVRNIVSQVFGPGVKPLADFKLKVPKRRTAEIAIKTATFLIESGVPYGINQLASEFDHPLPDKSDALITPALPPAPTLPPESTTLDNQASAIPADLSAGVLADLQPFAEALAACLQDSSKIADLDTSPLTAAVLKGDAATRAMTGEILLAFLQGSGATAAAAKALLDHVKSQN